MLSSFKHIYRPILLVAVLLLCGCGPKVIVAPTLSDAEIKSVAVLPTEISSAVRKERAQVIKAALESELQGSGFIVLEDSAVDGICPQTPCDHLGELFSKYSIDAAVTLRLESAARNNFIAGYYNAISGSLALLRNNGQKYFEVEHTESERGGLIFSSGQVIQGVINQVNDFGENESFGKLASKFVKTVVSKMPQPSSSSPVKQPSVEIENVTTTPVDTAVYQVCADGSAGAAASLLVRQERSKLREVSKGRYCGTYHLNDIVSSNSAPLVEFRSVFGQVARKIVEIPKHSECNLPEQVKLVRNGINNMIELPGNTKDSKFIIYKAQTPAGPYVRVAETRNSTWSDQNKQQAYYQVICVDNLGVQSIPTAAVLEGSFSA